VATLAVTRRHDLTDRQWAVLAPLLPAASSTGRPPKWEKRQLIDGIRSRPSAHQGGAGIAPCPDEGERVAVGGSLRAPTQVDR
jgi:hypothetical protein